MTEKTKRKAGPAKPAKREPSAREALAIAAARQRAEQLPSRVELKMTRGDDGSTLAIEAPHADHSGWVAHLDAVLGSSSNPFVSQSLARIATAIAPKGRHATEQEINAAIALMAGIAPQNELEAALGEQIVATHAASVDLMHRGRTNAGEYVETAAAYINAATKLSRTMCAAVETLTKLRSGGKQQVIVKHVYVDARGGQNVIASQIGAGGTGGGGPENLAQPHVPGLAFAPGLPVWSEDPARDALPTAGHAGKEALPQARREEPGGSEG